MRVTLHHASAAAAVRLAESDRALDQLLAGEDPVAPVKLPLLLARVILERALDGGDDAGLRAAVRAVKKDELVHPTCAHEARQDPVDRVLYFFLAAHRRAALSFLRGVRAGVERPIEKIEAAEGAARPLHRGGAVVIEAVANVLRRVASVHTGALEIHVHVFLKRQDRLVAKERLLDLLTDVLKIAERVHHATVPR